LDSGLTGRKNAERDWQGGRKRCPIEVGQDEEHWRGEVMGERKQKGQA